MPIASGSAPKAYRNRNAHNAGFASRPRSNFLSATSSSEWLPAVKKRHSTIQSSPTPALRKNAACQPWASAIGVTMMGVKIAPSEPPL
jgi:hypothetical protein